MRASASRSRKHRPTELTVFDAAPLAYGIRHQGLYQGETFELAVTYPEVATGHLSDARSTRSDFDSCDIAVDERARSVVADGL